MFKINIKIAFRNFLRNKITNLTKIVGLIVGLTAVILLTGYLNYELSYDKYNENYKKLYRVQMTREDVLSSTLPEGFSELLNEEIPEIENNTSLIIAERNIIDEDRAYTVHVARAEQPFFDMFGLALIAGDKHTALTEPNTAIITKSLASKIFSDKDAIGKSIQIKWEREPVKIVGVIEDVPQNTHFQADLFLPIGQAEKVNFKNYRSTPQYILLKNEGTIDRVQEKLQKLIDRHNFPSDVTISFLPVSDIHLKGHTDDEFRVNNDIKYIYIFSISIFLILLVAIINFINLTVASSLKRSREIGVKKVLGASLSQLRTQFLSESYLYFAIATCFAVILSYDLFPVLGVQLGIDIEIDSLLNYKVAIISFCIIVFSGFIAGFYPAVILSKLNPVKTLKGNSIVNIGGVNFKKTLLVFQFSISALLIISSVVINNQIEYIRNKNLGLDKENLLQITSSGLGDKKIGFENELLKHYEIKSVSSSSFDIANRFGGVSVWPDKIDTTKSYRADIMNVDLQFFKTLNIELLEGRFFDGHNPSDLIETPSLFSNLSLEERRRAELNSVMVLNETAVREYGIENPVNKTIDLGGLRGRIIGVAKDFNAMSLHNQVTPMVMRYSKAGGGNIYLKIQSTDLEKVRKIIADAWKAHSVDPVPEFKFVSHTLDNLYTAEIRLGKLFFIFSLTSVLLCCVGLFGMIYYELEQRTKEIAIRKILGASFSDLLSMLNKGFVKMVILSNLIVWPVAYILLKDWLSTFYYRKDLSYLPFLITLFLCISITVVTISLKAFNILKKSPSEAIKHE